MRGEQEPDWSPYCLSSRGGEDAAPASVGEAGQRARGASVAQAWPLPLKACEYKAMLCKSPGAAVLGKEGPAWALWLRVLVGVEWRAGAWAPGLWLSSPSLAEEPGDRWEPQLFMVK